MKHLGLYDSPREVGYIGWIDTTDGTYFIDLDGKIEKQPVE